MLYATRSISHSAICWPSIDAGTAALALWTAQTMTCTSVKCKSERFAHWPLRSLHSFLLASIVLGILPPKCTAVNTVQCCHKLALIYLPDLCSRPSLQYGIPGQLGEKPLLEQLVGCRLVLHDVLFVGLHRFVILFCDMLLCELV